MLAQLCLLLVILRRIERALHDGIQNRVVTVSTVPGAAGHGDGSPG
jgi:hypothetical protein